MVIQRAALLLAIFWIQCASAPVRQFESKKDIRILASGNLGSEMEPCGCKDHPIGGIERKENYLRTFGNDRPIQVDTGDVFFESNVVHPDLRAQLVYKAHQVLGAYNMMGIDVMNVGDRDLAAGLAVLRELTLEAKFPIISSNLKDKSTGTYLFPRSAIVQKSGLKIAFLGVAPADVVNEFYNAEVTAEDPLKSIQEVLAEVEPQSDFQIVLTQLSHPETQELAQKVPQVKVWYTADTAGSDDPVIVKDQIFLAPQVQGQKLSFFRFRPRSPINTWVNVTMQPRIQNQIDSLQGEIDEIKTAVNVKINTEAYERIQEKEASIAQLKLKLRQGREGEVVFQHQMVEMDPEYDGKNSVTIFSTGYKTSLKRGHFPETKVLPYLELQKLPPIVKPKGEIQKSALGVSTFYRCRTCHEKQWDFWAGTTHFSAMNSLYSRDQHMNRECITCHSIGFKEPKGWTDPNDLVRHPKWHPDTFFKKVFKGDSQKLLKRRLDPTRWSKLHSAYSRELAALLPFDQPESVVFMGVQCEHCHGRREGHPNPKLSYPKKVTAEACLSCHQPEHSDGFSFEKWLPLVACPLMQ